jgi:hypothetical protein
MITGDLRRIFSLQSGLVYSPEGTGVNLGSTVTGSFKVDYLRIPALRKARTERPGSAVRPHALTGLAFGVKVRCRVEASNGSTTTSADCGDPAIGVNLTGGDFAWVFGLGVDFGRVSVGRRSWASSRSTTPATRRPTSRTPRSR